MFSPNFWPVYFWFFILIILFSTLINRLFLKFAVNLGVRNEEKTLIRWSSQIKPSVGGLSFYIVFLLSLATYFILFEGTEDVVDIKFLGILSALTLAFIIGLADDAYNTNPLAKFMGQLTCGIIISYTGTNIEIFDSIQLNSFFTIFWTAALMNSLNMLDNMDGITTVVSIFILLGIVLSMYAANFSNIHFMLVIGVLGALLGFLYYNWNPSKVFMGDTGSQFIGCFLSIFSIIYFWNFKSSPEENFISKKLILVGLAFLIPLADTTTVSINRMAKGKSPFVGGKDHTTHNLSYLGFSDRQVAYLFISISLVSLTFLYLIINFIKNWNYWHFGLFVVYIAVVASTLFAVTHIKKKPAVPK
jgi:UDP-GlcNAc:undecaprenyl-phosphate/decaprenyl-phosphate GlcNAc-1-phosphate transferase